MIERKEPEDKISDGVEEEFKDDGELDEDSALLDDFQQIDFVKGKEMENLKKRMEDIDTLEENSQEIIIHQTDLQGGRNLKRSSPLPEDVSLVENSQKSTN